jgi:hypothetical protein
MRWLLFFSLIPIFSWSYPIDETLSYEAHLNPQSNEDTPETAALVTNQPRIPLLQLFIRDRSQKSRKAIPKEPQEDVKSNFVYDQ